MFFSDRATLERQAATLKNTQEQLQQAIDYHQKALECYLKGSYIQQQKDNWISGVPAKTNRTSSERVQSRINAFRDAADLARQAAAACNSFILEGSSKASDASTQEKAFEEKLKHAHEKLEKLQKLVTPTRLENAFDQLLFDFSLFNEKETDR